jgi:hypothetical protein
VYCARPKGGGTTPATGTTTNGATTTDGAKAVSRAFVAGLNRIEGPYKKWAADVLAELRQAGSQSDATLASHMQALAKRAVALSRQLESLQAPAVLDSAYRQLVVGTNKSFTALERITGAAATHNAAGARRAVGDLNQALVQAADGITSLKRAGVK